MTGGWAGNGRNVDVAESGMISLEELQMEDSTKPLEAFNEKWTAFENMVLDLKQLLSGTIMRFYLAKSVELLKSFRRKFRRIDCARSEIMESVGASE